MTIVSGLRNKPGETPEPHAYIESTWLNCVKPWSTAWRARMPASLPISLTARTIGQDTRCRRSSSRRRSRARASRGGRRRSRCRRIGKPRAVFQKLFGQGDTDKERAAILHETGSILDASRDRRRGCRPASESAIGVVVSDYLDSCARSERRVQMAETRRT